MDLKRVQNNYIKTDLAQKLYATLKSLRDNDNFATGVIVNCETDENIQKMLNFIETKNPSPKEILFYSVELDKKSNNATKFFEKKN